MTNMPVTADPDLAFAERDLSMLKGGGMESDRPYITWGQLVALRKAGRGQELRKYALIMKMPGGVKNGTPGAGAVIAMPAEKVDKWYGQGYRACLSSDDLTLVEFPTPPEPKVWFPSMVEEALQRGEVIPEEMAPAGYIGPTLSIKAMREQVNASRGGTERTASDGAPEIFYCTDLECSRFFDSETGRSQHERTHKAQE